MKIGLNVGRFALVACLSIAAAADIRSQDGVGASSGSPFVLSAAIEGPIGPASVRHLERVVTLAGERRPEALILRLNTPGGLATSMREIITEVLAAPVPVIGWVAPSGAHAASAGTYILYATHVSAMAPGTNIGAATPVQIGGMPGVPPPQEEPERTAPEREDGTTMDGERPEPARQPKPMPSGQATSAKATNDAVAFIRSLAEMHGRNADWAEKAVREAASLSAEDALKEGVIDLIASDPATLLEAAHGRVVTVLGHERTLATSGLPVELVEPDPITRMLGVLSNPNVALVLMLIGIYGIIFEFWNPGGIGPGVVGAICLTLGLYALNQLPLDYTGLALIGLGIAFMVAEAMTPTFGVFGIGGLVAFVLGAAMLIDTDVPAYQLSPWVIGVMTLLSGGFLILVLGFTYRAYRRAPVAGLDALIGEEVRVIAWSGVSGSVWLAGERWHATGPVLLAPGDIARIRGVDGLTLVLGPPVPREGQHE